MKKIILISFTLIISSIFLSKKAGAQFNTAFDKPFITSNHDKTSITEIKNPAYYSKGCRKAFIHIQRYFAIVPSSAKWVKTGPVIAVTFINDEKTMTVYYDTKGKWLRGDNKDTSVQVTTTLTKTD